MSHPPIPPGCPYLLDDKGALRFTPPGLFENDPQQMQDWRPIIASVAEVGWLKEKDRIEGEAIKRGQWLEGTAWQLADASAKLWREWGEQ